MTIRKLMYIAKKSISLITIFLAISCKSNEPNSYIKEFYNYPNPFRPQVEDTIFKINIQSGEIISGEIEIYSKDGNLIDKKNIQVDKSDKKSATCIWSGIDKNGKYLPAGIYLSKVKIKDNQDSTFIKEFLTSIK